ncbi:MAG: ATP-binding protein, partial [Acidobacteria bacterium]|nr:ATP-binding protein [Acidobacteriota bacterium]
RRDLYLIFKEAIANAAKYSNCGKVEIDFDVEGGKVILRISDDGRGFDVSQKREGNGLENMKRRAAMNRGRFAVESKIGGGTTVEIEFPQH